MANTINGSITANGLGYVKANIDGTVFNKILTNNKLLIQTNGVGLDANNDVWKVNGSTTNWKGAVNAVDIDWNAAVIPYGNLETGGSATVNSTGELLSLISKMQQEIHYTPDSIFGSPQNFYNDLVSNKKVYIENAPVIYYKITGDTSKTIVAYTFTDYMGVPYAMEYECLITVTSGSSDDVWECTSFYPKPLYNYFSPIILINVGTSTRYLSDMRISVGNKVITIPIDGYVTYFLQSCDIFASTNDAENTYWRLDGRNIGSVKSSTSGSITRYMYRIDNNERYTVSITWNVDGNTAPSISIKATLINS